MDNGQIPQNLIDRINELANKKKTVGLTPEEKEEQGFRNRIEMLQIYDKDGKEVTPEKVKNIQRKRGLRDD